MNKINFQDLPNTTTPVNASNLNAVQTNAENAIAESGSLTLLATLTTGTSSTETVQDLSQFKQILLQCNYHSDINRVMGSAQGTYQQFKTSTLAWNCSSGDITNYLATAKYNSDTSVTLTRKGNYDAVSLFGIK